MVAGAFHMTCSPLPRCPVVARSCLSLTNTARKSSEHLCGHLRSKRNTLQDTGKCSTRLLTAVRPEMPDPVQVVISVPGAVPSLPKIRAGTGQAARLGPHHARGAEHSRLALRTGRTQLAREHQQETGSS